MQEQLKNSFLQGKPPTVIFILMTLTNILINLDHGILPACTKELEEEYDMNETELGFLGSTVYLGIVIMGIFAGRLYQKVNSKILTLGALIALQVSLALFIYSDSKALAYACRFLTGVCQVFLLVYYPIWIDKFGLKKKTLWLTLLQICVPIGIFAGYGMTSVVISLGIQYKYSFYFQIGLVAVFIVAFGFLSKKKLDSRRKLSEQFNDTFMSPSIAIEKQKNQSSLIMSVDHPQSASNLASAVSEQEPFLSKQTSKKAQSAMEMVGKLLKSKMYFVGTVTMSVVLFVSTGIQFWLTDYFIFVLLYERQTVNIAYAIISITAPTSGCAFGGYVLSKKGGYDSPKAVYWVFLFSCFAIGAAVSIPFLDEFFLVTPALWIVLFCGGAMMPGLTGIMMASVPPYLRAFGNSTGQIIKNCLGYLPAPFVYGWFNEIFDDPRAGIKVIMFWGLWAPLILGIGSFYRLQQLKTIKLSKVKSSVSASRRKRSMDNDSLIYGPDPPQSIVNTLQQAIQEEDENALISEYLAEKEQDENQSTNSEEDQENQKVIFSSHPQASRILNDSSDNDHESRNPDLTFSEKKPSSSVG